MIGAIVRGASRLVNPGSVDMSAVEAAVARQLLAPGAIPGMRVTARSGIAYPPVWRCINLIAGTVAGMPWRFTQEESRTRLVRSDDPLDLILYRHPNDEMGPFTFRETIVSHALSWGDGYAEIERSMSGEAYGLWPIASDRVAPQRDSRGRLFYEVTNYVGAARIEAQVGPSTVAIAAEDMFHLRGLGHDGICGYSPIELHARAIATGRAADRWTEQWFLSGGQPFGIIKYAGSKLSPEVRARIKRLFYRMLPNRSSGKGGGHVMLPAGFDYQPVSVNAKEAALIEARKYNREEIAIIYGVPPHMVGGDEPTLANIEHRRIEFATSTILPWVLRLEEEANLKLVGRDRMAQGYTTSIQMQSLLRADTNTRANYYRFLAGIGAFSINDVLALEEMPTIGPDGDVRLVQEQMTPLSILSQIKLAKSGASRSGSSGGASATESMLTAAARERNILVNMIESVRVGEGGAPADIGSVVAKWKDGASERFALALATIDPASAPIAGYAGRVFEVMAEASIRGLTDPGTIIEAARGWPDHLSELIASKGEAA